MSIHSGDEEPTEMQRATLWALAEIIRDNSLWEVIRIVWSVRYGALGRMIDEKRRSSTADAATPAAETP